MIDGDRNTRFYHLSTVIRRQKNNISTLQDESGDWVTEQPMISALLLDFFRKLYTDEAPSTTTPPWPTTTKTFPTLMQPQIAKLGAPFNKEEIKEALSMMSPYKAPGPDGFPAAFYQNNWEIVGDQISSTILNLLNNNQLPTDLGDALMVLIPKTQLPTKPSQFRPISLLNVCFKLATKMIVNRLKPLLADIISPAQASFIPGRQIIDNVVIVQEVLHSMAEKRKRKWMMIKIDLEKAYDRINWVFLRSMLELAQFPPSLIEVIMHCQTGGSMELLLNGSKAGKFTPTRGIRQGDPLSPYLFVICMELLTHIIETEVENGSWRPISVGGVQLSHIFFADDLILFAEASTDQGEIVKRCLDKFCSVSGEKVNFDKSNVLFARSVPTNTKNEVSSVLSIPVTSEFQNYLGVPLACGRMTASRYNYLLDKVSSRLTGWQMKTLSFAGRVTLANSVLTSLPLYTMQ